jgi:hypothetical protein
VKAAPSQSSGLAAAVTIVSFPGTPHVIAMGRIPTLAG